MRALRIHKYGGPEVVRIEEVEKPLAGPGQIAVRVRAASVNPIDWKMRRGLLANVLPISFPRILGRDCAGETESGGLVAGVADPRFDGTHAEYALLPVTQVAAVPAGLDAAAAASLCVAGLSAWIPLVEVARVAAGQRVLVHAGAGGVGSIAIQIARQLGAQVVVTASAANREYCMSLGAAEVIDYRTRDFRTAGVFDAVLDTVGGETHRRSMAVLKPGGTLVALSAAPIPKGERRPDIRVAMAQIQPTRERLANIFRWAASGLIKAQVTRQYMLESRAYEISESGHARGKIVMLP